MLVAEVQLTETNFEKAAMINKDKQNKKMKKIGNKGFD